MVADPLFERLARALAGRYTLVRELGHGGMGTVYLATDLQLHRPVAIKVLPPETRELLGPERFQREVHLAAQLSHPHIVPLFEAGEAHGLLFYVMECVEGESLKDRLEREGPLPLAEAVRITAEVGDALQYAHEHGIIHRDIKPANILLCRGHAVVADFGIAKATSGPATGDSLTGTGVSVGTPAYMSPEQASSDKRIDARTDVYGLAAVLYEMLAGEAPFTGPSVQVVVARVIADEPRPIHTIRREIPAHVERAVEAGLAKLPADRPASAQAFVDMLVRPTGERPVRRRRRWPWLVAAGAVTLAGAWALLVPRNGAPGSRRLPGMALVPGGTYRIGGGAGREPVSVTLDSFQIDSTEATVAQYRRFVEATETPAPWTVAPPDAWPVTGVLWAEAQAYCRWRDSTTRLPTEEEWEAAARGPSGSHYPWGDAWAPARANAGGATDTLAPVGAFPLGRSWVGAEDLVGNAWEWTATPGPSARGTVTHVIKGGAFNSPPQVAAPGYRAALSDDRKALYNTGFRCARAVRP